jgi:hypothetical protein
MPNANNVAFKELEDRVDLNKENLRNYTNLAPSGTIKNFHSFYESAKYWEDTLILIKEILEKSEEDIKHDQKYTLINNIFTYIADRNQTPNSLHNTYKLVKNLLFRSTTKAINTIQNDITKLRTELSEYEGKTEHTQKEHKNLNLLRSNIIKAIQDNISNTDSLDKFFELDAVYIKEKHLTKSKEKNPAISKLNYTTSRVLELRNKLTKFLSEVEQTSINNFINNIIEPPKVTDTNEPSEVKMGNQSKDGISEKTLLDEFNNFISDPNKIELNTDVRKGIEDLIHKYIMEGDKNGTLSTSRNLYKNCKFILSVDKLNDIKNILHNSIQLGLMENITLTSAQHRRLDIVNSLLEEVNEDKKKQVTASLVRAASSTSDEGKYNTNTVLSPSALQQENPPTDINPPTAKNMETNINDKNQINITKVLLYIEKVSHKDKTEDEKIQAQINAILSYINYGTHVVSLVDIVLEDQTLSDNEAKTEELQKLLNLLESDECQKLLINKININSSYAAEQARRAEIKASIENLKNTLDNTNNVPNNNIDTDAQMKNLVGRLLSKQNTASNASVNQADDVIKNYINNAKFKGVKITKFPTLEEINKTIEQNIKQYREERKNDIDDPRDKKLKDESEAIKILKRLAFKNIKKTLQQFQQFSYSLITEQGGVLAKEREIRFNEVGALVGIVYKNETNQINEVNNENSALSKPGVVGNTVPKASSATTSNQLQQTQSDVNDTHQTEGITSSSNKNTVPKASSVGTNPESILNKLSNTDTTLFNEAKEEFQHLAVKYILSEKGGELPSVKDLTKITSLKALQAIQEILQQLTETYPRLSSLLSSSNKEAEKISANNINKKLEDVNVLLNEINTLLAEHNKNLNKSNEVSNENSPSNEGKPLLKQSSKVVGNTVPKASSVGTNPESKITAAKSSHESTQTEGSTFNNKEELSTAGTTSGNNKNTVSGVSSATTNLESKITEKGSAVQTNEGKPLPGVVGNAALNTTTIDGKSKGSSYGSKKNLQPTINQESNILYKESSNVSKWGEIPDSAKNRIFETLKPNGGVARSITLQNEEQVKLDLQSNYKIIFRSGELPCILDTNSNKEISLLKNKEDFLDIFKTQLKNEELVLTGLKEDITINATMTPGEVTKLDNLIASLSSAINKNDGNKLKPNELDSPRFRTTNDEKLKQTWEKEAEQSNTQNAVIGGRF